MTTLPAVAKKIFYPCKKCDTDRYQVVLAHTNSKSAKLECEVCKTKNVLKLESPNARSRSTVPKKTSSSSRAAAHVTRWNELRDKSANPVPYSMKSTFQVGHAVEHPKFGLGFVVVVSGQAMQVVFEDEERSLVHGRG